MLCVADTRHGAFSFRYLMEPLGSGFSLTITDPLSAGLEQGERIESLGDLAALVRRRLGGLLEEKAVWVAHGESALALLWLVCNGEVKPEMLVAIAPAPVRKSVVGLAARIRGRSGRLDRLAGRLFDDPIGCSAEMLDYTDPAVFSRQELRWLASRYVLAGAARATAALLVDLSEKGFDGSCRQFLEGLAGPCPVGLKLICGTRAEKPVVEYAHSFHQALAGSELFMPEDCGPVVHVENPAVVLEAVRQPAGG